MLRIEKKAFAQQSWDTGDGHAAKTNTLKVVNGIIRRVDIIISSVQANPTVDVTITDENSCSLITFNTLTDGTRHVKLSTSDATDFDAIPVSNDLTVSIDPSADPGGSGQELTVDVILYLEK